MENKAITKGVVKCIVLFLFSVGSLLLSIWIGKSMGILFNSVLDKYLNYSVSMLYMAATVINRIFSLIFFILLAVSVVKLVKHRIIKKNRLQFTIIFMFAVLNIIFIVTLASLQSKEIRTVDSVTVKSYVDIHEVFDVPANDASYSEQTNFGKVSSEIPVNYEVQQMNSEYIVQTSCVQIIDSSLLSEYYDEQKELFSGSEPEAFSEIQLKEISADNGCFWSESESSLNILIIKGDKVFHVHAVGEGVYGNDRITKQLRDL